MRATTKLVLIGASCLAIGATAATAGAIVPPTDCGYQRVEGKRYQIKADQMRCTTAKTYSRRYLADQRKPTGYSCKTYPSSTKLKFRCAKGIHVVFAIRR